MASPDHGAQKPIRARGSSKCPHHRGKEVIYLCENCKELACVICVSQVHKGHDLEDLGNITRNAKSKLQDFINKSENHEIPRIKGKIRDTDSEMSQKKKYYQKEISQIEKQNEILVEELNKATKNLVKLYRDMEKQDMDILHNQKTELQAQVEDCNSRVQECKDTLQTGNDIQVYDILSDLPSEFKDIPAPKLTTPSFTPGKFTLVQLERLVGEVKQKVDLNPPPHQAANYSVVSQFTSYEGHRVKSMRPVPGNKVWICLVRRKDIKNINKMLLVNHKGEVQQTLDVEVCVNDFCVSPISGNLWFIGRGEYAVREERGGEGSVAIFSTYKIPHCICLTADDHVVIGYIGELVKYTQKGEVIHKTPGGDKPLVILPYHISQCSNTGHLALVDRDAKDDGGSGHPFVWILDDQLNPLHNYQGGRSAGQRLAMPFSPWDVCYSANRSLVITDYNNKCVLLVNEEGEYLQTLYTFSDSQPTSVCVHHDGVLWVSFPDGSVELLKSE